MVIVIADDDPGIRNLLQDVLKRDHELIVCEDGSQALAALEKNVADLVITDHQMPNMTGLELVKRGKKLYPSTSFLMMTAFGTVEQAVEAIKLGADDYFMKPIDLVEIKHHIRRIDDLRSLRADETLRKDLSQGARRLIGKSKNIQMARKFVKKSASVLSPVLLSSPSGVDNHTLATAIHESGQRTSKPFVAIHCCQFNEPQLESELFGHEKDTTPPKLGKFESAKGGTLFLNEVGVLTPNLQAKLLRVLEEKTFFRVGGLRPVKTETRVIVASSHDLKQMVAKGSFREDLFFRLNVLSFELAPLSERKEDIPLLIEQFWSELNGEFGKKLSLSGPAKKKLLQYDYPGNVRELKNILERLVVLGAEEGVVEGSSIPEGIEQSVPRLGSSTKSLSQSVESLESALILKAMEYANFNELEGAKILQITQTVLKRKLKKYG